jgi:NADPH-dependent F420 reductase
LAKSIGFIGGTGPEGKGLAARFALAGLDVIIGSRSAERGEEAAAEVRAIVSGNVRGATNGDAAREADLIVVTIPYSGLRETLEALRDEAGNKIVVSAVVPLQFSKGRVSMLDVADGSAAQEAQALLPDARVVGAFQNLSAGHLLDTSHEVDGDVVVTGDDAGAVQEVIELAALLAGVRGVKGGPLSASPFVEGVTAMIVGINRAYKTEAGIRITGV